MPQETRVTGVVEASAAARGAQGGLGSAIGRELALTARCLASPTEAMLSKLAFLIGIAYLVQPIDLIPDRLPFIGHLDEIGFVLGGLIIARVLAPQSMRALADPAEPAPPFSIRLAFALRVLRADLANFFLLQYRSLDGLLITGKNSGTHWLKFMLSCAIAEQHGVPPPPHASGPESDAIIGHPRWKQRHRSLPRIGSSHTIPSIAFAWRLPFLDYPPTVLLVRDPREALASNYVKWRQSYGVDFATYLRGDPSGRRFVADAWWYIHFFNRWGDLAQARPERVLIVHYEELQADPDDCMRRIANHLNLGLSEPAIAAALTFVERQSVQTRLDPQGETIIPDAAARDKIRFSAEDAAILDGLTRRYLRHTLGYALRTRFQPSPPLPPLLPRTSHTPRAPRLSEEQAR